ncbi:hypothetical protein ACFU8A_16745, partial [Streptomyces sp. NPDC057546]
MAADTAAFAFLVPVLARYIAYGMADRAALVPGFVGSAIALTSVVPAAEGEGAEAAVEEPSTLLD